MRVELAAIRVKAPAASRAANRLRVGAGAASRGPTASRGCESAASRRMSRTKSASRSLRVGCESTRSESSRRVEATKPPALHPHEMRGLFLCHDMLFEALEFSRCGGTFRSPSAVRAHLDARIRELSLRHRHLLRLLADLGWRGVAGTPVEALPSQRPFKRRRSAEPAASSRQ